MARKLPTIPTTLSGIPRSIVNILSPMRQIMELRFFKESDERVVTKKDLVTLGLITQEQADKLEL